MQEVDDELDSIVEDDGEYVARSNSDPAFRAWLEKDSATTEVRVGQRLMSLDSDYQYSVAVSPGVSPGVSPVSPQKKEPDTPGMGSEPVTPVDQVTRGPPKEFTEQDFELSAVYSDAPELDDSLVSCLDLSPGEDPFSLGALAAHHAQNPTPRNPRLRKLSAHRNRIVELELRAREAEEQLAACQQQLVKAQQRVTELENARVLEESEGTLASSHKENSREEAGICHEENKEAHASEDQKGAEPEGEARDDVDSRVSKSPPRTPCSRHRRRASSINGVPNLNFIEPLSLDPQLSQSDRSTPILNETDDSPSPGCMRVSDEILAELAEINDDDEAMINRVLKTLDAAASKPQTGECEEEEEHDWKEECEELRMQVQALQAANLMLAEGGKQMSGYKARWSLFGKWNLFGKRSDNSDEKEERRSRSLSHSA